MKWYRFGKLFGVLAILVLVLAMLPVALAQEQTDKIETALFEQFGSDGRADFIVRFAEQADLSPAYDMSWEERGWFVYETLKEVAERSQARARAYLDSRGLVHHTFIAGNDLYVWGGDLLAANSLAALPEVAYIRALGTYYYDPIIEQDPALAPAPEALAWGIIDTNADDFWAAFGVQGDGIVVASIDSGVQWDHPALDQGYKCPADPGNNACWEDPDNTCPSGLPCDPLGHGTHTMGTMIGDDDPALTWQAGMAPNALWITCNAGSPSDYALRTCADWILAPAGNPDNRPHVVNNSWGGGGCDNWYLSYVQAWRAAGTFPGFSAGNSSGCGSMGSPGDYQESFASTGHNVSRVHSFAQGPSCYGHEPYTKPNITAPAVSVCSSIPGNGWSCGYSGTSMASPHSVGAVALLWSCNPGLIGNMDGTFEALQNGADPPDPPNPGCGVPPDNEGTYEDGYGYLNIYNTGLLYCGEVQAGYLDGYVYDAATSNPIQGANVTAVPSIQAVTDPNGYYTMSLIPGTYDVTASAAGYAPETVTGVQVITGQVTHQDFYLMWQGQWMPGPSNPPFQYNRFDGVFDPVDGLIYFPGGRIGGATHDRSIYTYDPLNDLWADTGCDLQQNAANITAVLLEDDGTGRGEAIYVFGGYDAVAAVNINAVQRYYPSQAGCVVETVTSDPYPDTSPANQVIGAGGVAEVNGKVYVFGGWESVTPYFSNKTWEYDPAAAAGSRWTELAATLTPARAYIQVAAQGGLIYAMGGHISYAGADLVPTTIAEVYDPANPGAGWTAIASMPVASAEGRGFGFDVDTLGVTAPWTGKLYVVGGGDWPDQSAEAMEYDIASDTWDQTFPDLITARRDHAGVFVPLCTLDPADGLPGMWVFGGRITADEPPFGNPEYYPLPCAAPGPPTAAFTADPTEGCAPLEVQFTDESTGNPPIDSWLWDFGDGTTSPLQHPTHTYDITGTYVVLLTVGNISGTDSVSDTITVHPAPEASFDYAPGSGMVPLTVYFTNTSLYAENPTWDFGDGGSDAGDYVSHTYMAPGMYDVVLSVDSSFGCGTVTATGQVEVLGAPPTAAFEADPTEGCAPLTVSFTDQSTGDPPIDSWLWEFGDGLTSTLQNPTHTYGISDTYVVLLTVESVSGTDSVSDTITVRPLAQASFAYDPAAGLVPLTVYFSNTSLYAISPTWDFGDGFGDVGDYVNHTYDMTGTYYVTLTVDSPYGCGTAEAHGIVEVYTSGPPRAEFGSDHWAGFVPLTVQLTDESVADPPIFSWLWDFDDGMTSTVQHPTHTFGMAGTYDVLLTVENLSGTDSISHSITVWPLPEADFEQSAVYGPVPLTVHFTNTSQYAISPTWDFGDGSPVEMGDYVSHTYAVTGTFTVVLTVTSPYGDRTATAVGMVRPGETCDEVSIITVTTTITGCEVAFSAEVTGTAPFEYLWEFGDGMTSTEVMPVHTYGATGAYTVTLHVWNCYQVGHAMLSFPVDVECAAYSIYLPLVFKSFP